MLAPSLFQFVTKNDQQAYDGSGKTYAAYGFEYKAAGQQGNTDEGYSPSLPLLTSSRARWLIAARAVSWVNNGKQAWTLHGSALKADPVTQVSQRLIPEEPVRPASRSDAIMSDADLLSSLASQMYSASRLPLPDPDARLRLTRPAPLTVIANLGISEGFGYVNFKGLEPLCVFLPPSSSASATVLTTPCPCSFPVHMRIDYVRVVRGHRVFHGAAPLL